MRGTFIIDNSMGGHVNMKKIIVIVLILMAMVFLNSCNKVQDDKDEYVQTEYDPNDWDGKEECEKLCEEIVKKVSGSENWDEKLTEEEKEIVQYHNISEDGAGIMMMHFYDEGSISFRSYVYFSGDFGNTWIRKNNDAHVFKRIGKIFSVNRHIIVSTLEGSNMAGFWTGVYVSHNAGSTFDEVDLSNIIGGSDMRDFTIQFEVNEIDCINERVVLSWLPYSDEVIEPFLTAEYNMDFWCTKIIDRNDAFYEVIGKVYGNQFIFPESDKRFLTEEEINEYKHACKIFDGCVYFDSFEEMLSRAINEIYARKGYDFTDTKYEDMFDDYQTEYCKEMYTDMGEIASMFNEYEQANVDLLARFRDELKE